MTLKQFFNYLLLLVCLAALVFFMGNLTGCGKSHHDDHNECQIPEHAHHLAHPAHPAHDDHPDHPLAPAPVVTVEGVVNHDVAVKHDSRSAPDFYRIQVNGLVIAETTFTTRGDGNLVPFVKFSTYQGDVVIFETSGSNEAIVDQMDLEFVVTVQ